MGYQKKLDVPAQTIRVAEVAARLDISAPAAYALVKADGFPALKVGNRIVIPRAAFERWLEQAAFEKRTYSGANQ
ncbi:MAG: hypothetical protein DDT37_01265 [Firmicutes bacterium]|nr:hypothetical protein [candidate division NPL-UPA2 bacterium]